MYFASGALARKVEKLAMECWKPVGLSPSHAYLLLLVLDKPGVQPNHLSVQLQLTPSTITRLIEKLEEKKLVTRTNEGKNTSVFPTEEAVEMLPLMKACRQQFHDKQAIAMNNAACGELPGTMNRLSEELGK
ncbi:MarR family winged helix-turn-helix transcriptional regulator [Parasegetibacter sp. NRK P23]|uniref:MarR family winged helix-turn-helix transcriptional regulator n=1 Tax=Parasegetibacter sp. NRK P23 TaxID=2942999 RepID=UPI002043457B|nr:helix-turn-helix domain-containing protein [Parasegetibacter sp. NRK P23]MCM5529701.1 MarR family transcriptional regulator [Parasegetibacter sp. NRK P23]